MAVHFFSFLSSTSQGCRARQLILTKLQCFMLVLACGGASHCEFTPPASSQEPLSTCLTPNVLIIHHGSQKPPRNIFVQRCSMFTASSWQPHFSVPCPKAELLHCLLLLRLHFLLRTNRTILMNVVGFYLGARHSYWHSKLRMGYLPYFFRLLFSVPTSTGFYFRTCQNISGW